MPLMLIAILTTLIVTWTIATKWQRKEEQLVEPRAPIPVLGIQIICGDCSGEQRSPIKTYLDRFGCCAQCGGRSYVLASTSRASYAFLPARGMAHDSGAARVLPFGGAVAHAERSKISA